MDREKLVEFIEENRDSAYRSADNLLKGDYESRAYFNGVGDALQMVLNWVEHEGK